MTAKTPRLPEPECRWGYTDTQVREIVGDRYDAFVDWMEFQTMSLCEAREYDHNISSWVSGPCTDAHGVVVYPWDLRRFLGTNGGPVVAGES